MTTNNNKEQFQQKHRSVLGKKYIIDDQKPFKKLFHDICLVTKVPRDEVERFKSGIVIPHTIKENKNYGRVEDVGQEIKEKPEIYAEKGDVVMMFPNSGFEITLGKFTYQVVRHKDFWGVLDLQED